MSTSKITKKIIPFIKSHYKFLLFFLCLSSFNAVLLYWSFVSNSLIIGKTFIFMLIGSLFLETSLCVILYFTKKHQWKIEKIFLIFGIAIGSIYTFAIPPGRAPDEASHFFRIYEILEGYIVSDTNEGVAGSNEPSNIMIVEKFAANNDTTYKEVIEHLGDRDNSEETFINTTAYKYNPVSYAPQIIGMGIGKILHLPILVSTYIAKFANMLFCIIILYFCIKKTPMLKDIIFLLAFLPISLQSMCSLSADGIIFVSAIALICFVLHSIYSRNTQFTKKHFFIATSLCILLTISKIVYAPLCLILFCIPKERFGNTHKKFFWVFGVGIITIVAFLIWYFASPSLVVITDSATQISFIVHNPIKYLAIVTNTLTSNIHETLFFFSGAFGGYLEWYNVTPTLVYILAIYTTFILLCAKARQSLHVTKTLKLFAIFLFPMTILAIYTTMFITWTEVGKTIINGVQGRYFLPILLLIPICFLPIKKLKAKKPSFSNDHQNYYLYAFVVFECVYTISIIACAHI